MPGASTLPPWRGAEATPLVRVFLVLSYDDVRHTYNSLAAHVTCSQRELYTPRAGDWSKVSGELLLLVHHWRTHSTDMQFV